LKSKNSESAFADQKGCGKVDGQSNFIEWVVDCFVGTFRLSRSDMRKLASHKVAGNLSIAPRPERTLEITNVSVVPSGQSHSTLPYQPQCGWLISIVASRQKDGFCRAILNLLYRRIAFGRSIERKQSPEYFLPRRFQICDTAECNSALRRSAMIAGCATVLVAHSALACGPWFPNNMLDRGDAAVLVAPVADFYRELDRMQLSPPHFHAVTSTNSYAEETLQAELADLRAALHETGKSSNDVERIVMNHLEQRAKLQKFVDASFHRYRDGVYLPTETQPAFPSIAVIDGLPGEFGDYFQGAIIWNDPAATDKTAARAAWEKLLQRPPEERHYKSTWTAFMLGRSWEAEDPKKARDYYQQVRALAAQGFSDPAELAAASLGWEARLALRANEFETALDLYLQQYAADGYGSALSLRFAVARAVDAGPKALAPLAINPQTRRLITAYLISEHHYDEAGTPAIHENVKAWLEAVEQADVKDVESAEQFALAAYQADEMELAIRWINRAGNSPTAQWLTAKLYMRAGKIAKATEILSQIVNNFPIEEPTNSTPESFFADGLFVPDTRENENVAAGRYIRGELGALRLSRREYIQSLDLLLRGNFWEDAAYVADHVLTTDELKTYVDGIWPAITPSTDENESEVQKQFEHTTMEIRYLLARRLARESHIADARPYYPAEWQPKADQLMEALTTGWDESLPTDQRGRALAAAAFIARTNGMELLGTEAGPDWHAYSGDFEGTVTADVRTNEDATAVIASADELKRNNESKTDPDKRFHYRYQAAALGWEAAKLMPNNSDETARILCAAGSWLKAREPEAADVFYKALVRRCRKTAVGAKADEIRWFPEIDDDGNLVQSRLEFELPSAQEISSGNAIPSYAIPGKHFIIMEGDRVKDIVTALQRLGFSITAKEIYAANPELTQWDHITGGEILIPLPDQAEAIQPAPDEPMPTVDQPQLSSGNSGDE
jgi:hypothetical protein